MVIEKALVISSCGIMGEERGDLCVTVRLSSAPRKRYSGEELWVKSEMIYVKVRLSTVPRKPHNGVEL